MLDVLYLIGGIIFLFLGGDGLVRGSVSIAEKLKLSMLLISTIFIGFGTSAPELIVSLHAALQGLPEIALGNIVGSNISNILLVLGSAAILSTIPCESYQLKRDAMLGIAASIFLASIGLYGYIHRSIGFAMLLTLGIYLTLIILSEKQKGKPELKEGTKIEIKKKTLSIPLAILLAIVSIILLAIGAKLLIDGAVSIADQFGISKVVIGLTVVAVGTSLPELATALIASWRKHPDMVIGNILGSNLFNILFIGGATALIKPIPFTNQLAKQDVWIMLATSILLLAIILLRKKITRLEGGFFLILYTIYVFWLYLHV